MEIGSIVKDDEVLKKLESIVQKEKIEKQYNIKEGEIVTDKKTIDALNKFKETDQQEIQKEDSIFQKIVNSTIESATGENQKSKRAV